MIKRNLFALLLSLCTLCGWATTENNPQAVVNLVNRVCGQGASEHFTFILDDTFNSGAETFQLGYAGGKVTVRANTMSALTYGLNWYLNHDAHVNIAWNNLTQTPSSYPAPSDTQKHTARGKYRYYLNYCTFSYSMSFWDEDRWMKEVDWMALHGVNLPLQIVGMDAVWYYMLKEQFGFSHDEASAFVAGPAFQGWWLMNNLTGHGGKNPEWWYERQAALGKKITDRMRELGMAPCLPGYVGMAPQKYVTDTGATSYSGSWCGFASPLLIAPGTAYTNMAAQYYAYIQKIFGFMPTSFSIDPAHERGVPSGMNYQDACDAARTAMNAASPGALWVAQEWQVNADQGRINALPVENTLLLDLSSERLSYKGRYGAREYLFCMLHNYGGNVGMYGCMMKMLSEYSAHLSSGVADGSNGTLMGVGATPEGIETNPVLYDLLFELPWLSTVPTAEQWLADYTVNRYDVDNANAKAAWENLCTTVYANTNSNQQGCREPVFCSRPNLSGYNASSWAGASYDWDKNKVIEAAEKLLSVNGSGTNYEYDVVDFVRQAITDYAHTLQMDMAGQAPRGTRFAEQADAFLAMMDDVDELLGTVADFRMGKWAGAARKIATESGDKVYGTGTWSANTADANWLELNARMIVTTWGNTGAATNNGGLRDYGNREWQGLIKDYYKPRWVRYFNDMKTNGSCSVNAWAWMAQYEWPYVYGKTIGTEMSAPSANLYADASSLSYPQSYSATPEGNPLTVAAAKFGKYFGKLKDGSYYSPWVTTDRTSVAELELSLSGKTEAEVMAALESVFDTKIPGSTITGYMFDTNGNGSFDDEVIYTGGAMPETYNQDTKCCIITSDGAHILIYANIGDGDAPYSYIWTPVEGNTARLNGEKATAETQYLELVNLNGKQVLSANSGTNLPVNTILNTGVTVELGSQVTVQFVGHAVSGGLGMRCTRLTAYMDFNGDGDFTDEGECLGTLGNVSAQDTRLEGSASSPATFTFNIPSDAKQGVTNLRLRFDGAWAAPDGVANSTHDLQNTGTATTPMLPQSQTNRNVYDLLVNVERAWPDVVANGDRTGANAQNQRVTAMTVNGTSVYTHAGNLDLNNSEDGPLVVIPATGVPTVERGQTVTVAWTGENLQHTRLSAYFDKNANGLFEHAAGNSECLGYIGVRKGNGANGVLNNTSISFTIPDNIPYGVTCLRLRFDGGWMETYKVNGVALDCISDVSCVNLENTSQTDYPVKPDYSTNRVVYDVHLNVVEPDVTATLFSTLDTPKYWLIQFTSANYCLTDMGLGEYSKIQYRLDGLDGQMWQMIGNKDGFKLRNRAGHYLILDGGYYKTVSAAGASAMCNFRLIANGDNWEIHCKGAASDKNINQYQGAFLDHKLSNWDTNDGGNVLKFVEPSDFLIPEFSVDAEHPKYYQIKFTQGNACLADKGEGSNLQTAADNARDNAQHWALVGTFNDFQLLNGTGRYAGHNGGEKGKAKFTGVASSDVHFRLVSVDGTGLELMRIGSSYGMNQDGGTGAGCNLCEWNLNSGGNHLSFVEYIKWTKITWRDGVTDNPWYVDKIKIDDEAVYIANGKPSKPYVVGDTKVQVYPGQTIKIGWENSQTMNNGRLTAFFDLNSDGTFNCAKTGSTETDYDPETLGIIGNMGNVNNNTMMNNFDGFNLTIPENLELRGETRLRLRFDVTNETKNSYYEQTIKVARLDGVGLANWFPYKPDAATQGIVYDIPFEIIDEPVVAFTSFVYEGWTYTCVSDGTNLTLLDATGGSGVLNIPATVENDGTTYDVVALDEHFLTGNMDVTKVVLPASVIDLGEEAKIYHKEDCTVSDGTSNGFATRKCKLTTKPLSGNCWNLTVKLHQDATTLNAWGTPLLCAAEDPFTGNFPFLFYQTANTSNYSDAQKDKLQLSVTNSNNSNKSFFDFSLCGHSATIEFKYRNGNLNVKVVRDDGVTGEMDKAVTISNVTWLSTAKGTLDNGIDDISYNFIDDDSSDYAVPFEGCTNLREIAVDAENPVYTSAGGALFDKNKYMLLRMPTVADVRVTAPEQLTMIVPGAFDVSQSLIAMTLTQCQLVDGFDAAHTSVTLTEGSDDVEAQIENIKDNNYVFAEVCIDRKVSATKWNTLTLPFDLDDVECGDMYEYICKLEDVQGSGASVSLVFSPVTEIEAGKSYIVMAKEANQPITVRDKTLTPVQEPDAVGTDYTAKMIGNYNSMKINSETAGKNYFFISNNKFYFADIDVSVKGYRAYVELEEPSTSTSSVRAMSIMLSDLTTGVEIEGLDSRVVDVYDLTGKLVRSGASVVAPLRGLPAGIYVVGGKVICL